MTSQDKGFDDRMLAGEIEALLFASESPLSLARLASITGVSSTRALRDAVESLAEFYRDSDRSFGVVEVAGGYQLATLPEYSGTVAMLFRNKRRSRLSQAALETLAIIAYRQPVSRVDIEAIRGVNCDGVISTLAERELIAITGRGEGVGRPYLYSTTSTFLEYLGLKDYKDLPDMEELEKSLETLDLVPPASMEDGTEETGDGEEELDGDDDARQCERAAEGGSGETGSEEEDRSRSGGS